MVNEKTYFAIFVVAEAFQIAGFVLASYGVLRQSFAEIAVPRPYGEGRYGEGAYGGGNSKLQEIVVKLGISLRLLPKDQALTVTDKKKSASFAVLGVVLLGLSIALNLALKILEAAI